MVNAEGRGFECLSLQFVESSTRTQKNELLAAEQLWHYSADDAAQHRQPDPMKRLFIPILTVVLATAFLTGCAWQIGGDKRVKDQLLLPDSSPVNGKLFFRGSQVLALSRDPVWL